MTIKPGSGDVIKTDLSIECPKGTYGCIAPQSGMTIKRMIDVGDGVIRFESPAKQNLLSLAIAFCQAWHFAAKGVLF